MSGRLRILCGALIFVAIANFAAFWVVGVSIGGAASNGRAEGGRYYVSSHGKLSEVSPRVWHYSRIHAMSVWVTHPLGLLAGALLAVSQPTGIGNEGSRPH